MNKLAKAHRKVWRLVVLIMASILIAACGSSDVGDQPNQAPVAVLSVLGAGIATSPFNVRSGMDVLVSGKDSVGTDGPILEYELSVVGVSGSLLTVPEVDAALFERTTNTKIFRAPRITEQTTVTFELTVTDADGDQATDTVQVNIIPVLDPDVFLVQDAPSDKSTNTYDLVAALNLMQGEVTNSAFEIEVETWAEWLPQVPHPDCTFGETADRCREMINTQTFVGSWPAGIDDVGINVNAFYNPKFRIAIPSLNIDEINKAYEISDREKRLELSAVSESRILQRFEFVNSENNAQLLISKNGINIGLLALDWGGAPVELEVDAIRRMSGAESRGSADAYYSLIDPENRYRRLGAWLDAKGFSKNVTQSDVAHAVFVNNYDLGFGRDMFMRRDECGNVYSYVSNYPTLEAALKRVNNFAIVVMEYSPLDNDAPCSKAEKIVKFYAYVPDESFGDALRMPSMNFDGRGEKFMPGVCTVCHAGSPAKLKTFLASLDPAADAAAAAAALDSAEALDLADLNATFMPFDLDSFLYAQANNSRQVDPSLNLFNLPTSLEPADFARESQLGDFRELNKGVMFTYLHKRENEQDSDLEGRFDAPIALVNAWYGSMIEGSALIDDFDMFEFDGTRPLAGWGQRRDLYDDVFARYCRACHIQLVSQDNNFDTAEEFLGFEDMGELTARVLIFGKMPLARLTMDRFWVNFDGEGSAAEQLQLELGSDAVPGLPYAVIDVSNDSADRIGQEVLIDGTDSVFVDRFSWDLMPLDGCNSTQLVGTETLQPSFVTDASPCEYTVRLNLLSNGTVASSAEKLISVDRAPVAIDFAAPIGGYSPGDSALLIDVAGEIQDAGDGGLGVIINNPNPPYELSINENVVNNDDGTVTINYPALAGVSESFEYRLEDVNGTVSSRKGLVTVDLDPIVPVVNASATVTTVTLAWTVPFGFAADSYRISRDDPPFDGVFDNFTTTVPGAQIQFGDTGLASNMEFRYQVVAVLRGEESQPGSALAMTNEAAVPENLAATAGLTSVQLTWDPPVSSEVPVSYNIFRAAGVGTPVEIVSNRPGLTYPDSGLAPSTDFNYQVQANYAGGVTSNPSAAAPATTLPVPSPEGLNIPGHQTSTTQFMLRWSAPSAGIPAGTVVTYNVYKQGALVGGSPTAGTALAVAYSSADGVFDVQVAAVVNNVESDKEIFSITRSYSANVFPIVNIATCTGCHGLDGGFTVSDSDSTWMELREDLPSPFGTPVGPAGPRLDFVTPAGSSILVCDQSGCGGMSSAGTISAGEAQSIIDWLNQGGLRN